jgi:hypothetical protein
LRDPGVNAEASALRRGVRGRAVYGAVRHRAGLQPRLQAGDGVAPRERGVGGRRQLRDPGVNAEASALRRGARGRAVYGTAYHRAGLQPRLQAGDGVAPRERGVGGRRPLRDPGVNAEASGLRGKARDDDEPRPPDAQNSRKGERGVGVFVGEF